MPARPRRGGIVAADRNVGSGPPPALLLGGGLTQVRQLAIQLGQLLLLFGLAQRGVGLDLGLGARQLDLADRHQLLIVGRAEALVGQRLQVGQFALGVLALAVVDEEVADADLQIGRQILRMTSGSAGISGDFHNTRTRSLASLPVLMR